MKRNNGLISSRIALLLLFIFQGAGATTSSCLLGSDSSFTQQLRPGVMYRFLQDQRGPWRAYIVEIDLTQPDLEIGARRALDKFYGREQTSSIAKHHSSANRKVIAALNSDFFSLKTGEIENNNIIDGEFVKGTKLTGSPFDVFDNIHSQFGILNNKKPLIDRFEFDGAVFWNSGQRTDILGVNDIPTPRSLVLFNSYYRASTPTDTLKMAIYELRLVEIGVRSDTLVTVVSGVMGSGGTPLTNGSLVLSGYDLPPDNALRRATHGDTVRIWLGLRPNRGPVRSLVGGWPRIVLDGRNIAAGADYAEGTFPRFSAGRHPRSGVGFSKDSTKVYFLAVDGRTQTSVGMSLVEFADLMLASGIYQGMNFDGGGSTTLLIDGKIVNAPSDPTGERPVGNCLLLFERKRK
ncbi:MAG: phosphodiester glycosidase family protein [Ignavibacteriales bacterium]|nr:phosphodiester glycosidase family protein [Ignavibacteriales bacterium]